MFARVSSYEIPAARKDEAGAAFRAALDAISEIDGFIEGFVFVAVDDERASTTTLWTTRRALEASRVAASRLRDEAAQAVDGDILSVVDFEVSAHMGAASQLLSDRP